MLCKNLVRFSFVVFLFPIFGYGNEVSINDFNSLWSGSLEKDLIENNISFSRTTTAPLDGPSFIAFKSEEPIDMKGRFIRFKVRINSLSSWEGIEMRLSSDTQGGFNNYFAIGLPFYSDPEFNIVQEGEWAEVTLTLGEAKLVGKPKVSQIHQIGIYIAGKATESVPFVVDLRDFQFETPVLPAVISMTFDDGYLEHYQAAQIMKKYNLRGTAYVMTREINQQPYLTSEQILEMSQLMGWSISSHHKIPITTFTIPELEAEIDQTYNFLENLGFSQTIGHFAYPLGKQNRKTTMPLIQQRFATARVAGGGAETLPPSDWYMLRAYNVTPDKTPQMIEDRIKKAIENKEWLIMMFHRFTDGTPENDLTYKYSDFEKLCEKITKLKVRVHPVNEVYEALHVQ